MATPIAPPHLAKRTSTVFLQVVIVLCGLGALALMLVMPHFEGRNAHATAAQVYFNDPFLAFAYIASLPFFIGLYQGFRVLGYAGQGKVFSQPAVRSLRTIKFCALAMIGFVVVSVAFLFVGDPEDRPPGVTMRVLLTFASVIVASGAATLQRIVQNALDLKSENDLTV